MTAEAPRPDDVGTAEQADRFAKARVDRAAMLAEDYVELIADLLASEREARAVDIARRLGVSHPTAVKTLNRLRREGLVKGQRYRGIFLTEAGHTLAEQVRLRHRIVVQVLLALGVPPDDAEADAEGIEHFVSPNTLAAFSRFLAAGVTAGDPDRRG